MYNAFGSEVTVIVPDEQLLKNEDSDIAAEMSKDMADSGIHFLFGERAEHVKDDKNSITINYPAEKSCLLMQFYLQQAEDPTQKILDWNIQTSA